MNARLFFLSFSWSANCVIGTPKVYPKYGDINGAWAHRDSNTRQEFIEVRLVVCSNIY